MKNEEDYWAEDDFEDTVAAALIACFETKFKKNRGAAPADRLTLDRVAMLRAEGPYIASNSRLIEGSAFDNNWYFDVVNDPLPQRGLHAFRPIGRSAQCNPNSYLIAHYFQQVQSMGRYWHTRKSGTIYQMLAMSATNEGIHGDRRYFSVTRSGEVVSCQQKIQNIRGDVTFGQKNEIIGHDDKWLQETGVMASVGLQVLADRRYCWVITAQEKTARAHLGCMTEEVKSLLYARSLPMTNTGRKRPILHLVEAHKRRMRSGTEVDVTAFLRGQQTVEIGGTLFRVTAPATLRPQVGVASQKRYFKTQSA